MQRGALNNVGKNPAGHRERKSVPPPGAHSGQTVGSVLTGCLEGQ